MKGGIFEAGMQLPALPSLISDWAWVESKRVLCLATSFTFALLIFVIETDLLRLSPLIRCFRRDN